MSISRTMLMYYSQGKLLLLFSVQLKNLISTSLLSYFADELFMNDDASSQSSMNSFKCFNFNCCDPGNEDEHDPTLVLGAEHLYYTPKGNEKCIRFCPREEVMDADFTKQLCNMRMDSHRCHGMHRLTRIRSFVDLRRQQLQRSLMEEIHKRRMFKTVGAVENIGFQNPEGGGCFSY